MKKRILSILTCLTLCLGLLPAAAFAADGAQSITVMVCGTPLTVNTYYKIDGNNATLSEGSATDYHVGLHEAEQEGKKPKRYVLTLNNANIIYSNGRDTSSISYHYYNDASEEKMPLEIVLQGANTVEFSGTSAEAAIKVAGQPLIISGGADDTLTAKCENISSSNQENSHGIMVTSEGELTINGGTITAIAIGGDAYNSAIEVNGDISIRGGTVNAYGNCSPGEDGEPDYEGRTPIQRGSSYGIWLENNNHTITITGGTVNAYGGSSASGASGGIGGSNGTSVEITGGTVTATGGSGIESYGIYAPDNSGSGGTVTIGGASLVEAAGNNQAVSANRVTPPAGGYGLFINGNLVDSGDITAADTKNFKLAKKVSVTYRASSEADATMQQDPDTHYYEDTISLWPSNTFPAPSGKTFGGWQTGGGTYQPGSGYTVTADTTFTSIWNTVNIDDDDDYEEPTYRVIVEETEHGEVKSNRRYAYGGERVTLTVTPEEGYGLSALTVTGSRGRTVEITDKGGGAYTFLMPYSNVTVTATFESERWNLGHRDCPKDHTCPIWPFTDAETAAWYHDGVHFCLENGLMVGCGNNIFNPDASATRAMIAVMLWRLNGSPVVNYAIDFEDVEDGKWYTEAIRWAVSEEVAVGYGNGCFGPDDDVTREQMVTILWRYAGSPAPKGTALNFADAGEAGSWAVDALIWAEENGIMQGYNNAVDPKGTATRAHAAQMFKNFTENVMK